MHIFAPIMQTTSLQIAIIGGGAAGCFSALSARQHHPEAAITLFEKQDDLMKKVLLTGGGRCNLTNTFAQVNHLNEVYPRGDKLLRKLFNTFSPTDTIEWWENHGLPLLTQTDERIFPKSEQAVSVVLLLKKLLHQSKVTLLTSCGKVHAKPVQDKWSVLCASRHTEQMLFDKVILTTGGHPSASDFAWLAQLGHQIQSPTPSLFTFNIEHTPLRKLMGTVAENVALTLEGTKKQSIGALLITHWGVSGPAVLRLSSYAAREIAHAQYSFRLSIHWVQSYSVESVKQHLLQIMSQHGAKQLQNIRPFALPARLWSYLLERIDLPETRLWKELGKKSLNQLVEVLTHDIYQVKGRTAFKEEFVTCGGVSLKSIKPSTLESKHTPGLYFAGEVLDIDAVTGGFNLQAAWTTGYVSGMLQ